MILLLLACSTAAISLEDRPIYEYDCDVDEVGDTGRPLSFRAEGVPTDRPILAYGVNTVDGWWMPRPFTPDDDGITMTNPGLDIQRCVVYGL